MNRVPKKGNGRNAARLCACVVLLLIRIGHAAPAAPEMREWSSRAGQTITAAIVDVQQAMVSLQGTNGVVLRIRISDLTPAGQAAVSAWVERKSQGPAYQVENIASNKVPVFLEGAGAKYHAVYTHPNFVARVTGDAHVQITLMDGTNTVGKPILMRPIHFYVPWRDQTRAIVAFDEYPKPSLNPKELTFSGCMASGVTFEWNYAFVDNTVQGWGWIKDPPSIEHPTRYHLRLNFPATHTFENSVPMDARVRLLAPFSLEIKPLKGKPVTYPFWKGQEALIGSAEQVSVEGPVHGPRHIRVTASNYKEGKLVPHIYRGLAPYEGFAVSLLKDEIDKRTDRFRLVLTID